MTRGYGCQGFCCDRWKQTLDGHVTTPCPGWVCIGITWKPGRVGWLFLFETFTANTGYLEKNHEVETAHRLSSKLMYCNTYIHLYKYIHIIYIYTIIICVFIYIDMLDMCIYRYIDMESLYSI